MKDMEFEHIETDRLCQVVAEEAVLHPAEIEHLKTCEDCLEAIRVLVGHRAIG